MKKRDLPCDIRGTKGRGKEASAFHVRGESSSHQLLEAEAWRRALRIEGYMLLALYIITLLVAIFDTSSSGKLFALCLFATVAIPLLIWIYIWMYGKLTGRRTIADFDAGVNTSDINKED